MGPEAQKCNPRVEKTSLSLHYVSSVVSFNLISFLPTFKIPSVLEEKSVQGKQEFMLTVFVLGSSWAPQGRETWENICLG